MAKKLVDSAHISFRITNDAVAEELALRAQASGSSPNLIARELVTEALCRVDRTTEQFNELDATLQRLMDRIDRLDRIEQRLLRGIHVLLRYGGKLEAGPAKMVMQRYFSDEPLSAEVNVDAFNQENGAG